MSTFADAFKSIVVPRLRDRCRWQAVRILMDRTDFVRAHADVMAYARKRGATALENDRLLQLDDWISTALLAGIDEWEPVITAQRERSERIAADIQDYFSQWRMNQ